MLTLDHPHTTEHHQPSDWLDAERRHGAYAAQAHQRWLITARVHPRRFREIVSAPFLEPWMVGGSLLLTLCAIDLRPAAGETGGLICALRIACRLPDGTPCTWVARRHADRGLAAGLCSAGLAQVDGGLVGRSATDRLELRADDGLLEARVGPGCGPSPCLFADAAAFGSLVLASSRSYTAAGSADRWLAVDLQREGGGSCEACRGWEGWLRTPWGDCTIDGVYRMPGGAYRWAISGEVDGHGRFV